MQKRVIIIQNCQLILSSVSSIIEIIDRDIIHPLQPYEIFIENEKKIYQISQDNILLNYV